MSKMITIYINGKEYKVEPGQTIMQAADTLGYKIPRLCYHPKLSIEAPAVCASSKSKDSAILSRPAPFRSATG